MLPAEKRHLKRRQCKRRISRFSFSDTGAFSMLSAIFSPPVWYHPTSRCLRAGTCLAFSPCPRHCKLFHSPCEPLQCLQTFLTTAKSLPLQGNPLAPPSDTEEQHPAALTERCAPLPTPTKWRPRPQLLRARCAHAYRQPSAPLPRPPRGGGRVGETAKRVLGCWPRAAVIAREVVRCGAALLYTGGHSMVFILHWRGRDAQCGCWVDPRRPPPRTYTRTHVHAP